MSNLSLSQIKHAQDECIDIEMWVHPRDIVGYDVSDARRLAIARSEDFSDNEFEDTPDTLITDYLRRCLDRRKELLDKGEEVPVGLQISPFDYIDALIYLVLELESSYACYGLGSVVYQGEEFITPQYVSDILKRLKNSFADVKNSRQADLLRAVTLEFFKLGYPWNGERPRYEEKITESDKLFLIDLLRRGPYQIKPY